MKKTIIMLFVAAVGVAGLVQSEVISVDFEAREFLQTASGSDAAAVSANAAFANVGTWNSCDVLNFWGENHSGWGNLQDETGTGTGVNLYIGGEIFGWDEENGTSLRRDYLGFSAPSGVSLTMTGLTANQDYAFYAFGSENAGRDVNVRMDTDGNGDLDGESSIRVSNTQDAYFSIVRTDGDGRLVGDISRFGSEGNISGFQIAAVPEAATASLMALVGGLGFLIRRHLMR